MRTHATTQAGAFKLAGIALWTSIGIACLSACGGGGGGGTSGVAPISQAPGAVVVVPTGTSAASVSISFVQYTPISTSSTRRATFVSPATQSMKLQVVSVDGAPSTSVPVTVNVTSASTNCAAANGVVTCTFPLALPIGNNVVLSATNYAGLNGAGGSLGSATVHATVVQNGQNLIPLSLGGTIAQLQIYLSQPTFPLTTTSSALVVVVPLDSSGAQIVNPGSYGTPINLVLTPSPPAAAHFHLTLNGIATGTAATILSPNDQVALVYDGLAASGSGNIKATTTGAPQAVANFGFVGIAGFSGSIGGSSIVNRFFRFTTIGGATGTGTINGGGGTAPFTLTSSDTSAVAVTGTSPNFTITSVGYGTSGTGVATLTLSDSASTPANITYNAAVIAPAMSVIESACGSGATCPAAPLPPSISIPPGNAVNSASSFSLSGATGTFAIAFVSSGTTTSAFATASIVSNILSITPNGTGSDAVIVTSGTQTVVVPVLVLSSFAFSIATAINGSPSATAIGFRRNRAFNATLPGTVTGASVNPAALFSPFTFAAPTLTATPITAGSATVTFTQAGGGNASFPATVFDFTPAYAGGAATEAFLAVGQSDAIVVTGQSGVLSATSGNSNIVSVGVSGGTVTLTAVGNGLTSVALIDGSNSAVYRFGVSVTTTTIPIAGTRRGQ